MKLACDHILKLAAIFLEKVAGFDTLQALVKAKQAAPELANALDNIAMMFDTLDNMQISDDSTEQKMNDLADFVDLYDDLNDEIARTAPAYISNVDVKYFLEGIFKDAAEITEEVVGNARVENPFAQINEQTQEEIGLQLAGRTERKLEYIRNYNKTVRNPKRKAEYARIKAEDPEQHAVIKEDVNFRKKKHRENLTPEELAAQFKAHNETHRKNWRAKLTPEERAEKAKKHNENYRKEWRAKKRLEKLKQIQQG